MRVSKRADQISSFIAMDVLARANALSRAGEDVIHMEVGQPCTSAPQVVLDAAERGLRDNLLGYTEALGIWALRERIADHYLDRYGVNVSAEQVVVTTGSSAGFLLAFLAVLDEGARCGLVSPGYPCYRHILSSLGNEAVLMDAGPQSRWAPLEEDVERLHLARALGGVLIASPANPTGTMMLPERFQSLISLCEKLGIWFISDEIYHGLTYETPAKTALEFSENAIVINSFSKYYSMTGWRIGWMIVPSDLVRVIERLQQNLFISPPSLSQLAAVNAFDARDELEGHRSQYQRNRDILLTGLREAGLVDIAPADGAFYLYVDVSSLGISSDQLSRRMLDEIGVAATPGLDFDEARGARYLRFSYAGAEEDMRRAVTRLVPWVANLLA